MSSQIQTILSVLIVASTIVILLYKVFVKKKTGCCGDCHCDNSAKRNEKKGVNSL